jgi:hypothetical protein
MPPAHQRLQLRDAARLERDERLIEQLKLAPLHGKTKVGLHPQPRHRTSVHLAVEHLVARTSRFLGTRHRRRRPLDEASRSLRARLDA